MERKFKVGDRVNNVDYGDGKVIDVFPHHCNFPYEVAFESGIGDCFDDDGITLIDRPQPTETPKYDRAMIAAMAMQGLLVNYKEHGMYGNSEGYPMVAMQAVQCADELITELEKPKQ